MLREDVAIPVEPGRDTGTGRALLEGKVIHASGGFGL